jgi:hypothetical protein
MVNGSREKDAVFTLPQIPGSSGTQVWHQIIDTGLESPYDFLALHQAPAKAPMTAIQVKAMGAVVLQSPSSLP